MIRQVSLNIFGAGRSSAASLKNSSCGMASTLPASKRSTVSVTSPAPIVIKASCTTPTLSVSAIGRCFWRIIFPVSISCVRKNVVTPVSVSPLITAQLIGAAPRYCGNNEACRLNVPKRGISHTTSGNIRKATTICRSAFKARNSAINASSFSFSGCNTGRFCDKAYFFTGLGCKTLP